MLRSEHEWSLEELAHRAGISARTVRNIETGFVLYPQPSTVSGLAKAFNISSNELRTPQRHSERKDWRSHLARLEQQQLGVLWVEGEGQFSIDPAGTQSDITVARERLVQQLHDAVIQKARLFDDASKRLDNALGWHGIAAASKRFVDGVQRSTEDVPNRTWIIPGARFESSTGLRLFR
jgi:transcriptional regulator with XRE-family HTH domain